ncbi:TetR/AcrR family transcriptional regulator [Jiangella aurantiaca]|nr:TetR/AcrR family transcriptional regulator [Jiangella aurantiaca]
MTETPSGKRVPAAERRESILAAASVVFGDRGYAGATTDQIAAGAGISQALVVRSFGGKEQLFLDVARRAIDTVSETFRQAIADTGSAEPMEQRLAHALVELIADRGILLSITHMFALGHDAVTGSVARDGLLAIYRIVRDEAGLGSDRAAQFIANVLLINNILTGRLHTVAETDADELLREACHDNLSRFRTLTKQIVA